MKYKAKISLAGSGIIHSLIEGSTHTNDNYEGIIAFIPFTDERFFEPVKTRKFVIEVDDKNMDRFTSLVDDGLEPWTVTEITNTSWIDNYKKSGSYNANAFSTDELYTIDIEEFIAEYKYGNKLQGVKWLKDRFGKGLKESKELADFIFAL